MDKSGKKQGQVLKYSVAREGQGTLLLGVRVPSCLPAAGRVGVPPGAR
jgi:hypothetical protein